MAFFNLRSPREPHHGHHTEEKKVVNPVGPLARTESQLSTQPKIAFLSPTSHLQTKRRGKESRRNSLNHQLLGIHSNGNEQDNVILRSSTSYYEISDATRKGNNTTSNFIGLEKSTSSPTTSVGSQKRISPNVTGVQSLACFPVSQTVSENAEIASLKEANAELSNLLAKQQAERQKIMVSHTSPSYLTDSY